MITQEEINRRFSLQEEYLGPEKPVNKLDPVVSVLVFAYQSVKYIKKCLNSILMQNTGFNIEIIIGEDQSSDGTREVCIEYANKFPDKVRLFLRNRELSIFNDEKGNYEKILNGAFTRMSARGKYIAYCEGDDYWIDPLKLQKQVDLLEAHPECPMCFHDVLSIWEGKTYRPDYLCPNDLAETVTLEDIVTRLPFIHMTGILVRRHVLDSLPEFINNVWCGDFVLNLWCAHHGSLIYLNEVMSVYRRHSAGMNTTVGADIDRQFPVQEYIYREFNRVSGFKYTELTNRAIKRVRSEYQYYKLKRRLGVFRFVFRPDKALHVIKRYVNIIRSCKAE
jgi:glycosyltransferase involved in cell wall biosynthesis